MSLVSQVSLLPPLPPRVCWDSMEDAENDEPPPPPIWRLTAFGRTIEDFAILARSDLYGSYFRNVEALKDMLSEQRRLQSKLNVLYLLSFAGACVVVIGPRPDAANISRMGVSVPAASVPTQIIAVVTASIYGMFATLFASHMVLSSMIGRALRMEGTDVWALFAARFDASMLWGALIAPRVRGYTSPRRHVLLGLAILTISVLAVLAHAIVIFLASVVAFQRALESPSAFMLVCGAFAVAMAGITILSLAAAFFLPLPFRWPAEAGEANTQEGGPAC